MDPDVTLAELRKALHATPDAATEECVELFDALDEWLSNKGYLPAAWAGRG